MAVSLADRGGFTKVPNELLSAAALAPWTSPSQLKIVLALIRATLGYHRPNAGIGTSDWRQLTGLSDRQIKEARKGLEAEGVLVLVGDFDARKQRPQIWRLELDPTKWGRFAIDREAVGAIESLSGRLYRTPHPVKSNVPGEVEGGRPLVNGSTPPLVKSPTPPLVNEEGGGSVRKTMSAKGLADGKERERQSKEAEAGLSDSATEADYQSTRMVLSVLDACNAGLAANPKISTEALIPLSPSEPWNREAVETLLSERIPLATIVEVVRAGAETYAPTPDEPQVRSLGYFTARIRAEQRRRNLLTTPDIVPDAAATIANRHREEAADRAYADWKVRVLEEFEAEDGALRERIESAARSNVGSVLNTLPKGIREKTLEAEQLKIYGREVGDPPPGESP